jgi:glycosyltransferase involved in cell wall biosynthesis
MQNNSYISVVICIYNGGRTLKDAIDSLLEQDYSKNRYEIILVNDGSSDNSELICRDIIEVRNDKDPKVTYVFQENAGLGSARNTAFNDDQAIGAVGGKIELLNNKSWFATFSHWVQYYSEDRFGKEIIPIVGTNMAFRKEVFQRVGGFFENFRSCGDETSFNQIKVLPHFKQNTTTGAVVYHERPWTFRQWFKERFSNGHEHALERHISQKYFRSFVIKQHLYFFYRINSLLFPVLMIAAFIFDSLLISTATIIIVAVFIYRCFLRDSSATRIKILTRKYGYFRSIWLVPLYFGTVMAGKINDDYGFLRGYFNSMNVQVKDTISGDKVKYLLDNSMNSNA